MPKHREYLDTVRAYLNEADHCCIRAVRHAENDLDLTNKIIDIRRELLDLIREVDNA